METEFVRRRGEMEKEKFSRMQLLQEEYQQKETERDTEKSEYFKELEVCFSKGESVESYTREMRVSTTYSYYRKNMRND